METVTLRKAMMRDHSSLIRIDRKLDPKEHVLLSREKKIVRAIEEEECHVILIDDQIVGFVIFDHRFFDHGWIELIIVDEPYRSKGVGSQVLDQVGGMSKTNKVFTSTNESNLPMQKALRNAGFSFAGQIVGLDEGDPEMFFLKRLDK